jgi:hypothetical protein
VTRAERAWALGDFRAAALGFDTALREATGRPRLWHRALNTERVALFFLARRLDHVGFELLAQAREHYLAWGARAKVDQLDWAFPALRPLPDTTVGVDEPTDGSRGRAGVSTGTLDLLGILSASQALSAQTSTDRLHTRVVEVLGAMTGATGVHLLLWSEDASGSSSHGPPSSRRRCANELRRAASHWTSSRRVRASPGSGHSSASARALRINPPCGRSPLAARSRGDRPEAARSGGAGMLACGMSWTL